MNDIIKKTPGSKWWKFDFHTHTPASYDYAHGNEEIKINTTPEVWLQAAVKAELDCVVVTDHNTGKWIDKLIEKLQMIEEDKPDWYRPLTIFPGVEINVGTGNSTIHLLAIFDPSKDSDTITRFMGAVGINVDKERYQDASADMSFTEVVRKIADMEGIAIPAHIDSEKGLLCNCKNTNSEIKKIFNSISTIELVELSSIREYETQLQNIVKKKAVVQGSDAHSPDDLGSRFTWIKMSYPTINELRLSLLDWENCIDNGEEDPNTIPDLYIESLSINDMKLCGRVSEFPFEMTFSPKFNAIIGGRGSGKSTVLESIRIAARRESELNEYGRLKEDIERFLRTDDKGLMLDNSNLSMTVQKMNRKFRIKWNVAGSGGVIDEEIDKEWQDSDAGNLSQRFPLNIYSQKQIFELASNPEGLLAVIDRSPEVNFYEWNQRWNITVSDFIQQRERARQLSQEISEENRLKVELKDIISNMDMFEKGNHANILKHYQKRIREINNYPLDNDFNGLSSSLQQLASQIETEELPNQFKDNDEQMIKELTDINQEVNSSLKTIKDAIITIAQKVEELSKARKEKLLNSKWYLDVQEAVKKYEALDKEYEERKLQVSLEAYQKWTQEQTLINIKLQVIESKKKELEKVQKSHHDVHAALIKLRKELCLKRQTFLNSVLSQNEYVSMEIAPFGDWEDVESSYRDILELPNDVHRTSIYDIKDVNEDKQFKGILAHLISTLQNNKFDSDTVLDAVHQVKLDTLNVANGELEQGISRPFINKMQSINREQPAKLDQLLCWWPKDKLVVKYSKEKRKDKFLDIERGSKGQKAAAILAFLLSYGDEPLIIDQPEDDLDNALIYELIVKQIHDNKKRRQMIIVTHNANIVVNGDAEYVNVLKMKNGLIQIVKKGGLGEQDIRHSICDILEGGKEAFHKRYERMTIGENDV